MKPKRLVIFRSLLCLAIFLTALFGVCWSIHQRLPFRDIPIVRSKIEHFAIAHDEYDTVFVGSSRVHYQIIPSLFDRLTREAGLPTASFNAGVAGMRPPETHFLFDQLMRTPPKNLRWVFIELSSLRTSLEDDRESTEREVYWHDLPRTWSLFHRAMVTKLDGKKRRFRKAFGDVVSQLGEFTGHLKLFLMNVTNFGRGSILTARLVDPPQTLPAPQGSGTLLDQHDGWEHAGRPEEISGEDLEEFNESLAERREKPATKEWSDIASQRALASLVKRVERLGARAVLVVPPVTSRRNFHPLPELAERAMVLDFSGIDQYPELFEQRHRLDSEHVNTAGSAIFTRELAREWAARVKAAR